MGRILGVAFGVRTTDATLVTITGNFYVNTTLLTIPFEAARVCVMGWAQVTAGTGTTGVTPLIRRNQPSATVPVIGESNVSTLTAPVGSTEQFYALAIDELKGFASVSYVFTLTQAGASGNGTILQGGIVALLLS